MSLCRNCGLPQHAGRCEVARRLAERNQSVTAPTVTRNQEPQKRNRVVTTTVDRNQVTPCAECAAKDVLIAELHRQLGERSKSAKRNRAEYMRSYRQRNGARA